MPSHVICLRQHVPARVWALAHAAPRAAALPHSYCCLSSRLLQSAFQAASAQERECCLLVLSLVSSTLPCIRQPRLRQGGGGRRPGSTGHVGGEALVPRGALTWCLSKVAAACAARWARPLVRWARTRPPLCRLKTSSQKFLKDEFIINVKVLYLLKSKVQTNTSWWLGRC